MKLSMNKINGLSQCEILLEHMIRVGGITKLQALELYGIMNTGGRIHEIRQSLEDGRIETIMFEVPSGKRVAKYIFIKD